jgi:hypothetical protein
MNKDLDKTHSSEATQSPPRTSIADLLKMFDKGG